jgi:hypothetical protein
MTVWRCEGPTACWSCQATSRRERVEQTDIDWKSFTFADRFGSCGTTTLPDTDSFAEAFSARSADVSRARVTFPYGRFTFFKMGERVAVPGDRSLLELPPELALEALEQTDFQWESFTFSDRLEMSYPKPVPDSDPLTQAIRTLAKEVSTGKVATPGRTFTLWKMGERVAVLDDGRPFEFSRELAAEVLRQTDVRWQSFSFADRFGVSDREPLLAGDTFAEAIYDESREVTRAEVAFSYGKFTFFKMGEPVAVRTSKGLEELPRPLAAEALERSDFRWRTFA